VVTERVPWTGNLAGVSSLGLGGANTHIILRRNQKERVSGAAPADSVPRLVVASGRTEEAVDVLLKDVSMSKIYAIRVQTQNRMHTTKIVSMPAVTASCYL
jgi:fatty acid synthase